MWGETMALDKGWIGGSMQLLLLSLLKETDRYGYEIIRELDRRSDHTFAMQEGTLYPVLHKLENKGYIRSYMREGDTGRKRKYYAITRKGIGQLAEEKKQWHLFTQSVAQVIGGDIHAFA